MQLRLPASIAVGAGVATPLAIGTALYGDAVSDAGTVYTLDLGVSSGSLSGQAFEGLTDLDPVGGSVRLSGTIAALNAWLAAGKLVYTGQGEALSLTLTRAAPAAAGAAGFKVAGVIALTTVGSAVVIPILLALFHFT